MVMRGRHKAQVSHTFGFQTGRESRVTGALPGVAMWFSLPESSPGPDFQACEFHRCDPVRIQGWAKGTLCRVNICVIIS